MVEPIDSLIQKELGDEIAELAAIREKHSETIQRYEYYEHEYHEAKKVLDEKIHTLLRSCKFRLLCDINPRSDGSHVFKKGAAVKVIFHGGLDQRAGIQLIDSGFNTYVHDSETLELVDGNWDE